MIYKRYLYWGCSELLEEANDHLLRRHVINKNIHSAAYWDQLWGCSPCCDQFTVQSSTRVILPFFLWLQNAYEAHIRESQAMLAQMPAVQVGPHAPRQSQHDHSWHSVACLTVMFCKQKLEQGVQYHCDIQVLPFAIT